MDSHPHNLLFRKIFLQIEEQPDNIFHIRKMKVSRSCGFLFDIF